LKVTHSLNIYYFLLPDFIEGRNQHTKGKASWYRRFLHA